MEFSFGAWFRLFAAALAMSVVVNSINRYSPLIVARLKAYNWWE